MVWMSKQLDMIMFFLHHVNKQDESEVELLINSLKFQPNISFIRFTQLYSNINKRILIFIISDKLLREL